MAWIAASMGDDVDGVLWKGRRWDYPCQAHISAPRGVPGYNLHVLAVLRALPPPCSVHQW
ncbi:hypothetical protein E4U45_003536, partial [Claviceps purpurea]